MVQPQRHMTATATASIGDLVRMASDLGIAPTGKVR
jgi:hypothetical protein